MIKTEIKYKKNLIYDGGKSIEFLGTPTDIQRGILIFLLIGFDYMMQKRLNLHKRVLELRNKSQNSKGVNLRKETQLNTDTKLLREIE